MPPHVFAVDAGELSYARFDGGERLEIEAHHAEELPEGLFAAGPLGGAMGEPRLFRQGLEELLAAVGPVAEASLVLPDRWLRTVFLSLEELPRRPRERDEALRFKLSRALPFRIDDLRLVAAPAPGLHAAPGAHRFAVAFALAALLAQLESAFEACGTRLGHVGSASFALVAALEGALSGRELGGVVHVVDDGYVVLLTRRGEPWMYRYKPLLAADRAASDLILRDLRLTRAYVEEQGEAGVLGELVLVVEHALEDEWSRRLEDAFSLPVRSLAREWSATGPALGAQQLGPLAGAAARRVA